MCGIVGYVGPKSTLDVLLGGLKRLEYRGYDSAGVSVIDSAGRLETRKRAGKLAILVDDIDKAPLGESHIGIGHTRWATHGAPTDGNAHPHLGGDGKKLSLIHNGIIDRTRVASGRYLADHVLTQKDAARHHLLERLLQTFDVLVNTRVAIRTKGSLQKMQ